MKCPQCGEEFATQRGLYTHMGKMHDGEAPRKRQRQPTWPAPPPAWPAVPAPVAGAPLPADGGGSDEEEALTGDEESGHDQDDVLADGGEGDDAPPAVDLEEARQEARRLLLEPAWVEWAEHALQHCEEEYLGDVGALFYDEEQFPNEETFRFNHLRSLHPGASFAEELLLANRRQHLDLDKVPSLAPFVCHLHGQIPTAADWHMPGICQFTSLLVWHMPGICQYPGIGICILQIPMSAYWHMPGICQSAICMHAMLCLPLLTGVAYARNVPQA